MATTVENLWTADNPLVTADSNYTATGTYSPEFPNVPNFPGVPQLVRATTAGIGAIGGAEIIASELGLGGLVSFGNRLYSGIILDITGAGVLPQYALLDSSQQEVLAPDSVVEVDVRADTGIMTHPIEQGTFSAYNRVQDPIVIRLMMACSGAKAQAGGMTRDSFLATLRSLREGTQLVTVVTPDGTYPNMALKGFGYSKRAERGAITIWADTTWMEARSTGVTPAAPQTSQPFGYASSPLGSVQLQPLTPQQLASVNNPAVPPVPMPSWSSGGVASGAAF